MSNYIGPERALIFRITHRENIPWVLEHGLHCWNSKEIDPNFRSIGHPDLIGKRSHRCVPIRPHGTLSDYVPFYFTPHSPMLLNIKTGRGVPIRRNDEIVILVSSLPRLQENSVHFVFSDRHAYLRGAQFFDDLGCLDRIDWDILRRRDFKRCPDDPEKMERYQAEALVFNQLPASGLLGVVCYNEQVDSGLKMAIAKQGIELQTVVRPGWYF